MPFAELMNDKIDVLKKDGTTVTGLKASVQRSKIYMAANKVIVESGDLIQRRMSNGAEETYRVIDPGFHEGLGGIPANYQMEVTKLGVPEAKQAVQSITYNVTGNNARINQNSVDHSTNLVHIDARVLQHIAAIQEAIDALPLSVEEKLSAREVIAAVAEEFKSAAPKKSVVGALLNALPHVANVTTIVTALLALL